MTESVIPDCTCPEIDCVHDQLLAASEKIADLEREIAALRLSWVQP